MARPRNFEDKDGIRVVRGTPQIASPETPTAESFLVDEKLSSEFQSTHTSFVRAGLLVATGRFAGLGAAFMINFILARKLSQEHFGVFLLLRSLTAFAGIVAMCGMEINLVRMVGESLGHADMGRALAIIRIGLLALFKTTLAIVIIVAIILLCGGWQALQCDIPLSEMLFLAILITIASLPVRQIAADILRTFDEWKFSSMLSGQIDSPLGSLLFLVSIVGICTFRRITLTEVILLNAAIMTGCGLLGYGALVFRMKSIRKKVSIAPQDSMGITAKPLPTSRELVFVSFPAALIQSQAFLFTSIDVWMAGMLVSIRDLAIYGSARRLTSLLVLPHDLMMRTITPSLPRLLTQTRLADIEQLVRSATWLALLLLVIPIGVIFLFPGWIMEFAFGPGFRSGGNLLVILSLAQIAFVWHGTPGTVLMMAGKQRQVLIVNCIAQALLLISGCLGGYLWGTIGLAICTSTVILLQRLGFWFMCSRELNINTAPHLQNLITLKTDLFHKPLSNLNQ